jgi:hypothetical protein
MPRRQQVTDVCTTPEAQVQRIPVDLTKDGLLWLINRQVFFPRGYALGYDPESAGFFLLGNGSEPFTTGGDGSDEREYLDRVRRIMR